MLPSKAAAGSPTSTHRSTIGCGETLQHTPIGGLQTRTAQTASYRGGLKELRKYDAYFPARAVNRPFKSGPAGC
eukprot:scaffold2314_cov267-Pinguiococcus_pyrenoidosus.AAC.14